MSEALVYLYPPQLSKPCAVKLLGMRRFQADPIVSDPSF